MPRVVPSQILRFVVSIPVIALLTAYCPGLVGEKTAQPPSQRQMQARVKELEKHLSEAQQKAESATKALENRVDLLDKKTATTPKAENGKALTLIVASLAFLISFVNLWKGHFARFSPLALAGNIQHRIYPIRNRDKRWYITSFDVPVSVTNPGARPGLVTGIRLRLHYPDVPLANNYEFVPPHSELKPDKVNSIDKNRFNWLSEVVAADWSPFVILPKATVAKHLLFETRWDKPVVQSQIVASLELQADWRIQWFTVNTWKLTLPPPLWVDLVNGGSMRYVPDKGQVPHTSECCPADLHEHIGPKKGLPTEGILTTAEPSYLDYPEPEKD